MRDFFNYIIDFFNTIAEFFSNFGTWLLDKFQAVFWFLLESIIAITETFLITLIDSTGLFNSMATSWLSIPSQTRFYIEALQIPTAIALILGAYSTRLIIKLIPGI